VLNPLPDKPHVDRSRELADELKKHVRNVIGPVATPDEVRFAAALPKTRSGKIMRRLLKQVAAGEIIKGDTTTLEDINVIAALAASAED
jgi:acetyl-CoA synthetase